MAASDQKTFGGLLRHYRRAVGLSQEALAERAGISADTVASLERGRRTRPHPDTLVRIADVLEVNGAARAALFAAVPEMSPPLPDSPPVAPAVPPPVTPLPVPPTALVGREREEAAVASLLRTGARLVTLTGLGGVGKTRLAVAVAAALQETYDVVAFVALASVTDPDLVLTTVAQALGVREGERGEGWLIDRLADATRDRQMLLVLDNCEQVVDAAPRLAALLARAPSLTVLATSRERLQLAAEALFSVSPLPLPASPTTTPHADLTRYAAVRLFAARARAIQPDFALTDANVVTIAAICAHLDGLPLAIELAAARVRVLSPEALLARLAHRLQVLTGGARDQPERQRTLRAAIDWSHDLLNADEQRLFRRLAVFAEGMTLIAVEQVCALRSALDGLESLLDKSLLNRQELENGEPRFTMLETIREYADEHLTASGEADATREAHARYYLALVTRAGAGTAWRAAVAAEQGNLRAALAWTIGTGRHELGALLAVGLAPFWWAVGSLDEGRRAVDAVLDMGVETLPASLHARLLAEAGALAAIQGDLDIATRHYETSLALLGPDTVAPDVAALLGNLGMVVFQQGNGARALALLHDASARQEAIGDTPSLAGTHNRLGLVEWQYGDATRAEGHYAASITLARTDNNPPILAAALNNLGNLLLERGEETRATALFAESVTLRRQQDDKVGLPVSLHSSGEAARRRGDTVAATEFFAESLILRRALGDRRGMARCLEGLAAIALVRGRVTQAARLLGAATGMRAAIGAPIYPAEQPEVEETLGAIRARLGLATDRMLAVGRALTLDAAVALAVVDTETDNTRVDDATASA